MTPSRSPRSSARRSAEGLGDRVAGEFGERGVERDEELERCLAIAAVIEIEPGAERQVLADQGSLAAVHHRGEPGLGLENLEPAFAARAGVEFVRLAPQPVGDLLAGAPSDPGDERLLSPDDGCRYGSAVTSRNPWSARLRTARSSASSVSPAPPSHDSAPAARPRTGQRRR